MKPHDASLRAELESLLATLERIARSAAARRQRAAGRHKLGGPALDAKVAPYFAGVTLPALQRLSPGIVNARLRLEALDASPGDTTHAEFRALTELADRIDIGRAALLAAAERVRASSEQRRTARVAAPPSGDGGRAA